jgi:hypothetical protein
MNYLLISNIKRVKPKSLLAVLAATLIGANGFAYTSVIILTSIILAIVTH